MEYLVTGLFCAALVPLTRGAWLMMQDSELKHQVRKDLRKKYPHLSRDELRALMYRKLKEQYEQRH